MCTQKCKIFLKSLSCIKTALKVVCYSQSLCGVPSFRSPKGDVVLVVVDVVPIWIETPYNGLVASLCINQSSRATGLCGVPNFRSPTGDVVLVVVDVVPIWI